MAEFKGSKTEQNLLKAFAGESQASNRYLFAASTARKEGYRQIEAIFQETAMNEREHAKRFFSFLQGGPLEITATYPAGKTLTTLENLEAAAAGEKEEWTEAYPEFAKIAKEEGFNDIASCFLMIAKAEAAHEKRFLKLAENIKNGKVFKKDTKVLWKCGNCGFVLEAESAPAKCPACLHGQEYFEKFEETY